MKTLWRAWVAMALGSVALAYPWAAQAQAGTRAGAVEVELVPAVPLTGTFWSAQLTNFPPWPFNPLPELRVYAAGEDTYVFDDREVDYVAMEQQAAALRLLTKAVAESLGVEMLASAEGPPEPPGGGGGEQDPPQSVAPLFLTSTQLCLWPPVLTGSNALLLTLTNAEAGSPYDLFGTTNLSPDVAGWNLTNWVWLGRVPAGQTNVTVLDLWPEQGFFRLGTMADADGDGLPDAYERLISHTGTNTWSSLDSDGDGLPEAWELANGTHPLADDDGLDPDGDGLTNGQEYLGGSSPTMSAGFGVWLAQPRGVSSLP